MAAKQTQQSKSDFIPATWKGGYMHTPQAIRELLVSERISGAIQLQILLEVNGEQARARRDGNLGEWAQGLTIPKLAVACGRKRNQLSGVEKALADLLTRGLLVREPDGKTWIEDGVLRARSWKYKIDPNAWRDAPKCAGSEVEADAAEPEDESADDEKVAPATTWPAGTILVMPGKMSKTLTLREACGKVRFTSELPDALGCEVGSTDSGELHVRIFAKPAEAEPVEKPGKEEKAKAENSGVVSGFVSTKDSPDARTGVRASEPPKSSARRPAEIPQGPPANANGLNEEAREGQRASTSPPDELAACLALHAVPYTHSPVPPDILAKVRENLNGTPLEYLEKRIHARRKVLDSNGLLPGLAKDASDAYHAIAAHSRVPPPDWREEVLPSDPNMKFIPPSDWPEQPWERTVANDLEHWVDLSPQERLFYSQLRPNLAAEANRRFGPALEAKYRALFAEPLQPKRQGAR